MSPIGIKGEWGLYTRSTMIWLQMICSCWYWPSVRRLVVYKWDVLLYLWRCTFFKVIGFRVPTKAYSTIVFCTFFLPLLHLVRAENPGYQPLWYLVWFGGPALWICVNICLFVDNRNKSARSSISIILSVIWYPKPSVFSGGKVPRPWA